MAYDVIDALTFGLLTQVSLSDKDSSLKGIMFAADGESYSVNPSCWHILRYSVPCLFRLCMRPATGSVSVQAKRQSPLFSNERAYCEAFLSLAYGGCEQVLPDLLPSAYVF